MFFESFLKKIVFALVILTVALCFISQLMAAEIVPVTELMLFQSFGEIYSVSKKSEKVIAAPSASTVVTADELRQLGIKTIYDILRLLPGQQIHYNPRRSYLITRDVRASALVLLDGIPINNPADGEMILDRDIAIGQIKRIEVINGPGGILWGATAFVGIINIITKDPGDDKGLLVRGEAGTYQSYGLESSYSYVGKDWGMYLYGSGFTHKGAILSTNEGRDGVTGAYGKSLSTTSGEAAKYGQTFLKLKYKEDLTLSARFANHVDYFQMEERGWVVRPGLDLQENDPVRDYAKLEYNHTFDMLNVRSQAWTVKRTVYLTGTKRYYDGRFKYGLTDFRSRQNGILLETVFDKFMQDNSLLVGTSLMRRYGGVGYQYDIVNDEAIAAPLGSISFHHDQGVDVSEKVFSMYLQDTQKLLEKLTLSAGIRSDKTTLYKNVIHGSGTIVYNFLSRQYLKAFYTQGFRPPSWEQKYSMSVGAGTFGNELKPEESKSLEGQYVIEFGQRNSTFSLNYAKTLASNLANYNSVGVYENTGRINTTSVETAFRYNLVKGYAFVNYANENSEQDGQKIGYYSSNIANVGLFHKVYQELSSSVSIHYENSKTPKLLPEGYTGTSTSASLLVDRKIAGFAIVNIGFLYDVTKDLKTSLFVYNAFDKEYFSFGRPGRTTIPLPYPGRTINVDIQYMFKL